MVEEKEVARGIVGAIPSPGEKVDFRFCPMEGQNRKDGCGTARPYGFIKSDAKNKPVDIHPHSTSVSLTLDSFSPGEAMGGQ